MSTEHTPANVPASLRAAYRQVGLCWLCGEQRARNNDDVCRQCHAALERDRRTQPYQSVMPAEQIAEADATRRTRRDHQRAERRYNTNMAWLVWGGLGLLVVIMYALISLHINDGNVWLLAITAWFWGLLLIYAGWVAPK